MGHHLLRGPIRGSFYYLYLIVDVWSRKVGGWSLRHGESAEYAREFIEQAIAGEDVDPGKLVLHADNGGPMKGSTLLATLQRLGVVPSFSRPSVSDDNPFSEALLRTLKYRPNFPRKPFHDFVQALQWVETFVHWYNEEHLHSGIRYVTPAARHAGKERPMLAHRHEVYTAAKARTPRRWTRSTRNWSPVGAVYLNRVKQEVRANPHRVTSTVTIFWTTILIHTPGIRCDAFGVIAAIEFDDDADGGREEVNDVVVDDDLAPTMRGSRRRICRRREQQNAQRQTASFP